MEKPKGFRLDQLTLNHIAFVRNLEKAKLLSTEQSLELITNSLREMPLEVRRVLLPLSSSMVKDIYAAIEKYKRPEIAIYRDLTGKRYIAHNEYKGTTNDA